MRELERDSERERARERECEKGRDSRERERERESEVRAALYVASKDVPLQGVWFFLKTCVP